MLKANKRKRTRDVPVEWFLSLNMVERQALVRARQSEGWAADTDEVAAERHLELWKAQQPFDSGDLLDERARSDDMSLSEFVTVLGTPVSELASASREASWMADTCAAFFTPDVETQTLEWAERVGLAKSPYLTVVGPLLYRGAEQFEREVVKMASAYRHVPFRAAELAPALFATVFPRVNAMLVRTHVLEVNVARVLGRTTGETREARFQEFINGLKRSAEALAFLEEYPLLARYVHEVISIHASTCLEMLSRLCADWDTICAALAHDKPDDVLSRVVGGMGDTHRGGHSVQMLEFESGFRVVYKPRSLGVEAHFQELLRWMGSHGLEPVPRTISVVDRGSYGWVEFAYARPCPSLADVSAYYKRLGALVSILYGLEATDFHYENLVASGEFPILLDLEALFHPRLSESSLPSALQVGGTALANSVIRLGLLPHKAHFAAGASGGVDISGSSDVTGQLSPFEAPYVQDDQTDDARVAKRRGVMSSGENVPSFNGVVSNASEYANEIVEGFTDAYRMILANKSDFTGPNGPVWAFDNDEIRVIVRPTFIYSRMLNESYHPDLLRDALARDRYFDRLWIGSDQITRRGDIIRAERKDLFVHDIPAFFTRPCSRDVTDSRGEVISEYLVESPIESVRLRIATMSEDDLTLQVRRIRQSLATQASLSFNDKPIYPCGTVDEEPTASELVNEAIRIGDYLLDQAVRDRKYVTWITFRSADEDRWSLEPMFIDLYEGLPGCALFYAQLAEVSGREKYHEAATDVCGTLEEMVADLARTYPLVGGFNGWGGVIYTAVSISCLLGRDTLVEIVDSMLDRMPDMIASDPAFDVLNGIAGCIPPLLQFHALTGNSAAYELALQCGDRLIGLARPMKEGVGWKSDQHPAKRAPLGFSHGAAGIGWALGQLAMSTGEARFRECAISAVSYERCYYSEELRNWPDMRSAADETEESTEGYEHPSTWCYGAPGIGLSRIELLGRLGDAEDLAIRAECDVAIETSLGTKLASHSLCHGVFGNLETALLAGQRANDSQLVGRVRRIVGSVIAAARESGWVSGSPRGIECPGLMLGLAGVGYGLMRVAHPDRVPSILVLESAINRVQEEGSAKSEL